MAQKVGLIGYPIGHSVSPAFQQAAFDHHLLPVRYCSWPTPPEALEERVQGLRGHEYLGANVTIPHKRQVMRWLDRVDPLAETIGAVNTIAKVGTRLEGYNTDADGFIKALKEKGGFDARGARVLLFGAGGAGRAAAFGLANEGISHLVIADIAQDQAQSLAAALGTRVRRVEVVDPRGPQPAQAARDARLIVNCTPMGMLHGDAEHESPLVAPSIPRDALVYDVVYNPTRTPLLREAEKAGAATLSGLWMLVFQGAAAFERWTSTPAPVGVMYAAALGALEAP